MQEGGNQSFEFALREEAGRPCADGTHDKQIVKACEEKLAWGHWRVALRWKMGLPVNPKRVPQVDT